MENSLNKKQKVLLKENGKPYRLASLIGIIGSLILYIPFITIAFVETMGVQNNEKSFFGAIFVMMFLSIVFMFYYYALNFSIVRFHHEFAKTKQKATLKDFFVEFKHWWKAFCAQFLKNLFVLLWCYLAMIISMIPMIIAIICNINKDQEELFLIVLPFYILALVLCYVVIIIKMIQYGFQLQIISDKIDIPSKHAIKISKIMIKGYKKDIFVFWLSFIGRYLLAFITFGIYSIWLIPYVNTAYCLMYENIKRNPRCKKEEKSDSAVVVENKTEAVEAKPVETTETSESTES